MVAPVPGQAAVAPVEGSMTQPTYDAPSSGDDNENAEPTGTEESDASTTSYEPTDVDPEDQKPLADSHITTAADRLNSELKDARGTRDKALIEQVEHRHRALGMKVALAAGLASLLDHSNRSAQALVDSADKANQQGEQNDYEDRANAHNQNVQAAIQHVNDIQKDLSEQNSSDQATTANETRKAIADQHDKLLRDLADKNGVSKETLERLRLQSQEQEKRYQKMTDYGIHTYAENMKAYGGADAEQITHLMMMEKTLQDAKDRGENVNELDIARTHAALTEAIAHAKPSAANHLKEVQAQTVVDLAKAKIGNYTSIEHFRDGKLTQDARHIDNEAARINNELAHWKRQDANAVKNPGFKAIKNQVDAIKEESKEDDTYVKGVSTRAIAISKNIAALKKVSGSEKLIEAAQSELDGLNVQGVLSAYVKRQSQRENTLNKITGGPKERPASDFPEPTRPSSGGLFGLFGPLSVAPDKK
jgi:hypothetical protein